MDAAWLLTASAVSVYVFVGVVTIMAVGLVSMAVFRRHFSRSRDETPPLGATARTLIEYLGNTSYPEVPSSGIPERRRNRVARLLMDHLRMQAMAHDAAPAEVTTLVERLREAIQAAEHPD
jgi:hypothetical protein